MSRIYRSLALLSGLLLTGCITPPRVTPADRPIDERVDLGLGHEAAPGQDRWWSAYQDPQLESLLAKALADNPTLSQVMARLQQGQALVDSLRAGQWPHISYDADTARERFSAKDAIPPPYGGADVWRSHEGLNFSWELDFWGRQSSLVRQARGEVSAIALDAAAARLAIVGAVVRTYIDLERTYELVDIAVRAEQQRQQILDITQHRFNEGLETKVEVKQAEGAVSQARVERLACQAAIDRDAHLLVALAGNGAGMYGEIQRPRLQPDTVVSLPSVLPVDLLARRPDVLAARSRIGAARAGVAAAKADFYPNVDLLAFAGTVSVGAFDNLFHGHAATYGVGPALHLPLFDAGTRRANYRANIAAVDIAIAIYNQTVLAAVRDTADQLTDLASLNTRLTEQQRFLDDAEGGFRLATERYDAGLTSYLTVLATETIVLEARRQRVDLKSAQASARVTLLIDVGGDFR